MPTHMLPSDALELLTVSGPDAARLLQGQVTCDLDALPDDGFLWGAACNNKGRVICPFVLMAGGGSFQLVFGKGLAAVFVAQMKKFLPFYKCQMEAGGYCAGLTGNNLAGFLQAQGLALPDTGKVLRSDTHWAAGIGTAPALAMFGRHDGAAVFPDSGASDGGDALRHWQLGLALNGHYPFRLGDSERFTPQELHYDRKGYVSFSKGCYTGQEIVARMHYRGKARKQLYLVDMHTNHSTVPEDLAICDAGGNVLGHAHQVLQPSEGRLLALVPLPVELPPDALPLHCDAGDQLEVRPF